MIEGKRLQTPTITPLHISSHSRSAGSLTFLGYVFDIYGISIQNLTSCLTKVSKPISCLTEAVVKSARHHFLTALEISWKFPMVYFGTLMEIWSAKVSASQHHCLEMRNSCSLMRKLAAESIQPHILLGNHFKASPIVSRCRVSSILQNS